MHCELHHAHGDVVPFRVLCAVRTRLRSRWWFRCTLLFVQLVASRASSRCKQDMGALSWFNAETPERAPIPLFGRLVRCSAHGPFFARLRYIRTKLESVVVSITLRSRVRKRGRVLERMVLCVVLAVGPLPPYVHLAST